MAHEFFNEHREEIEDHLQPGEAIEDVEMMVEIIIDARGDYAKRTREEDERIAVWSLCFLGIPLKAAPYAAEVKEFRMRFVGIRVEKSRQHEFRKTITKRLLTADTVEELEPQTLADLFDEKAGSADSSGREGGNHGTGGKPEQGVRYTGRSKWKDLEEWSQEEVRTITHQEGNQVMER